MGVVVRADAPWQTLPELLAHARANPGKMNWGTLGIGSTQHLAMERVGIGAGRPDAGRMRPIAAPPTRCVPCWAARSTSPPRPRAGRRWSWRGELRLLAVFTGDPSEALPRRADRARGSAWKSSSTRPGGLIGPRGMDPAVVRCWPMPSAPPRRSPEHLEFLANMDQPLLLLDGPAYRDAMAKTLDEERELLRRLGLLPA